MYLVTAATPTSVTAQKILHPVSSNPTKFMSKSYVTHPKHTRVLHSPPTVTLPNVLEPALPPLSSTAKKPWSPTPEAFWDTDSDDDDFDDYPTPRCPPAPNPVPEALPDDIPEPEDDSEPDPAPPFDNIANLQAENDANIHEPEHNFPNVDVTELLSLTPPILSPSNSLADISHYSPPEHLSDSSDDSTHSDTLPDP